MTIVFSALFPGMQKMGWLPAAIMDNGVKAAEGDARAYPSTSDTTTSADSEGKVETSGV